MRAEIATEFEANNSIGTDMIPGVFKDMRKIEKQIAKEPGKCFGECESCGQETVLVKLVGLCGPCCFGEADTINGNW